MYEPRILAVLEVGQTFIEIDPENSNDISLKCDELQRNWAELNDLAAERYVVAIDLILHMLVLC